MRISDSHKPKAIAYPPVIWEVALGIQCEIGVSPWIQEFSLLLQDCGDELVSGSKRSVGTRVLGYECHEVRWKVDLHIVRLAGLTMKRSEPATYSVAQILTELLSRQIRRELQTTDISRIELSDQYQPDILSHVYLEAALTARKPG